MKVGWKSVPGGWTGVEEATFTKSWKNTTSVQYKIFCVNQSNIPAIDRGVHEFLNYYTIEEVAVIGVMSA